VKKTLTAAVIVAAALVGLAGPVLADPAPQACCGPPPPPVELGEPGPLPAADPGPLPAGFCCGPVIPRP